MNSTHETTLSVRYAETDQMKVVYYANYFVWMEQARTEHLESLGLPYHTLEKEGYFLPVMEAHATYLRPARYGDKIRILTEFILQGIKIKITYKMYCNDVFLTEGYTIHVFAGGDGKPVRPPRQFLSAIGAN